MLAQAWLVLRHKAAHSFCRLKRLNTNLSNARCRHAVLCQVSVESDPCPPWMATLFRDVGHAMRWNETSIRSWSAIKPDWTSTLPGGRCQENGKIRKGQGWQ